MHWRDASFNQVEGNEHNMNNKRKPLDTEMDFKRPKSNLTKKQSSIYKIKCKIHQTM